jgi:hypothetical protein
MKPKDGPLAFDAGGMAATPPDRLKNHSTVHRYSSRLRAREVIHAFISFVLVQTALA